MERIGPAALLKQAWRSLPEVRENSREDIEGCLARVVTMCIEEYYAGRKS